MGSMRNRPRSIERPRVIDGFDNKEIARLNPVAMAEFLEPFMERAPSDDPRISETAACRGVDPGLFYFEKGQNAKEAKDICMNNCKIMGDCMLYALIKNEKDGVWGATSPKKRSLIRRNLRKRGIELSN